MNRWSAELQGKFDSIDPLELRISEANQLGLILKRSNIKHEKSGMGVFAGRTIKMGEIVGYYYGTLVYHNLFKRKQVTKTYGNGVLAVTTERYRNYALQLTVKTENFDKVRDRMEDGFLSVCIVPAPFCVMGYVNSPEYCRRDKDYKDFQDGKLKKARKANCEFFHKEVQSPKELHSHILQEVRALRNIALGEELYVKYATHTDMLPDREE